MRCSRTRSFLSWDFSSTARRPAAAPACSAAGCPATTSTGRGTDATWRWGRARGMSIVDDGLRQLASPVKFSEFEFSIERPAPGSGEHTDEILREAGYGDAEIEALRKSGAV